MSCFTIENVRLVRFYIRFNLFNRKIAHFIELIIIFEVLWDLLTWWHDTNHRKPKPHAGIWENLLIMAQPAQRRCQISPWSHGHPLTSPETRFLHLSVIAGHGPNKTQHFSSLYGCWFLNEWNELPKMKNELWVLTLIFLVSKGLIFTNVLPNFQDDWTKRSGDIADWKSQEWPKSCMCILVNCHVTQCFNLLFMVLIGKIISSQRKVFYSR